MRIGFGYDVHRLREGRPLVVGGVRIPSPRGPDAHSDGDVVCHASADALLGAAALGDIGVHFPPSDPTWAGADSVDLLRRVARMVEGEGYVVVNLDVTVVLEAPRLSPHVPLMRERLAHALGIPPSAVSIKATTNEGLGEFGQGQGVAAWAVVLLGPRA